MDQGKERVDYRGGRVRLCEDGRYRWTYSLDMYRNPSILLVVLKIFGILWGVILLTLYLPPLLRGWPEVSWTDLKIWAIVLAVFFGICLLSYLIVARMYGGRYIVDFTMDEEKLVHSQHPSQARTARRLGALTALGGTVAKSPATAGAGMLAASRTESSSDFSKVRTVKAFPRRNLIKVNQLLERNQVYVPDEDFDFVLEYIRSRCPRMK